MNWSGEKGADGNVLLIQMPIASSLLLQFLHSLLGTELGAVAGAACSSNTKGAVSTLKIVHNHICFGLSASRADGCHADWKGGVVTGGKACARASQKRMLGCFHTKQLFLEMF